MQRNKLQDGQKAFRAFRILSAIQLQLNFMADSVAVMKRGWRGSGGREGSCGRSPFREHGDNLFMEPPWTLNGLPHKSCGRSTWLRIVNCRCLIIGLGNISNSNRNSTHQLSQQLGCNMPATWLQIWLPHASFCIEHASALGRFSCC